jgi:hypothetical protein
LFIDGGRETSNLTRWGNFPAVCQGHAAISTFDAMAGDPKTAPMLAQICGPDG